MERKKRYHHEAEHSPAAQKIHIYVNINFDITLTIIHVGSCRCVATLGINGNDPAYQFLEKLNKDDRNQWKQLSTRLATIANYPNYQNTQTFRHVGDNIFEFKRSGLRLYAFYDNLERDHALILCTNGGTKNNKKEQNRNIQLAQTIRRRYFEAKASPATRITLITES